MQNPTTDHSTTLETEGWSYNPFTETDIWGVPSALHVSDNNTLPVGADDRALPQLKDPKFSNPDYVVGSNTRRRPPPPISAAEEQKTWQLVLFAAVLGVALWRFNATSV